jgi:hypothetical protein
MGSRQQQTTVTHIYCLHCVIETSFVILVDIMLERNTEEPIVGRLLIFQGMIGCSAALQLKQLSKWAAILALRQVTETHIRTRTRRFYNRVGTSDHASLTVHANVRTQAGIQQAVTEFIRRHGREIGRFCRCDDRLVHREHS